jgi:competence protein ComEC
MANRRSLAGPLLAALLFIAATEALGAPRLRIDFISVGQGDAALVTSPTGKTVLVDGGPREGARELLAFLRDHRVTSLDLIVLTHRHADHLGGLAAVIRAMNVRLFMDSTFRHPSPAYEALMEALADRAVPVRTAERGRRIDLGGGAQITLLSPPEPPITGSRSDVNSNSVVMRLDYRQVGVLFTGDAEAVTENWLLRSGASLRANVLKVGHHGSRYSSTVRFLTAVHPSIAVISAGAGNDYGHPAPATLRHLAEQTARVYRTDLDGNITVETDGERIEVRTSQLRQETVQR